MRVGPFDDPDRYELRRPHSRGGEGELWEGSLRLDGVPITVAVKILHQGSSSSDAGGVERWRHQAELLRTLAHPSVVTVREVFEGPPAHEPEEAPPDGTAVYLVMNWVAGEPADQWVAARSERTARDSLAVIRQLGEAVDYLHSGVSTSRPVLHRDIKPGNVIVSDGSACLVDFGLARLVQHEPLTIAGTPAYLAPEVLAGRPFTEATDRFAVGATASFLLTGSAPDPTDRDGMRAVLRAVPTDDGVADLSGPVLAMLDPDPDARPASCAAFVRELEAIVEDEPVPAGESAVSASAASDGGDVDQPRYAEDHPSPPRQRRRRRLVVWALLVSWVLFAGAGVYAATELDLPFLGDDAVAAPADDTGGDPAGSDDGGEADADDPGDGTDGSGGEEGPVTMPDLIGDPIEDARSALHELGAVEVSVEEEDSGELPGTVLAQRPSPTARIDGEVLLIVAAVPAALPDLVGRPLDEALPLLAALGIEAEVTEVLDEDRTDRTIVDQSPDADAPYRPQMDLVVARRGVGRYLVDLTSVEGEIDRVGVATVDGQEYTRSLVHSLDSYRRDTDQIGYDLGRRFERFAATVGLSDDSGTDDRVRFEVMGDGTVIAEATLGLGESEVLDVDVTDVLRLELISTRLSDPSDPDAVFADARVVGLPGQVPDRDDG